MEKRTKRARSGESIAETLVAVLIMALVFLMLTTAVMAAARINAALKNPDVAYTAADPAAPIDDSYGLTIRVGVQEAVDAHAKLYQSENGYYYYEFTESTPGGAGD